jgi:hypothetical protein
MNINRAQNKLKKVNVPEQSRKILDQVRDALRIKRVGCGWFPDRTFFSHHIQCPAICC